MKTIIFFSLSLVFLSSCGGNAEVSDTDSTKTEPVIDLELTFVEPYDLPKDCDYKGEVVDVHSWQDLNGKNYIIRTISLPEETENPDADEYTLPQSSQYIYAFHYVENDKKEIRLLHEVTDFIKDCEFDIIMGHVSESLDITDINENKIGELTLMYRKTCTSDISPSEQFLCLFENGNTYSLKGYSEVMGEGGTFTKDAAFETAPEGFLNHATILWDIYKSEMDS